MKANLQIGSKILIKRTTSNCIATVISLTKTIAKTDRDCDFWIRQEDTENLKKRPRETNKTVQYKLIEL